MSVATRRRTCSSAMRSAGPCSACWAVSGRARFARRRPSRRRQERRWPDTCSSLERVPEPFNAGFSLYAAAWPLLEQYPGSRFQTGLFGTWMFAQFDGEAPKDLYSDIEGGLGWWRDTRFATTTPKFIMGGVAPNFSSWANGPGAGKAWDCPLGKFAAAPSPGSFGRPTAQHRTGTCANCRLWLLPRSSSMPSYDVMRLCRRIKATPFLNTANFKGPLCFFTLFLVRCGGQKPNSRACCSTRDPPTPTRRPRWNAGCLPCSYGCTGR